MREHKWSRILGAAVLASAAVILTGCSAEEETVLPTAVLEQEENSVFGLTAEAQRILRKSIELGKGGWRDTGNLNLGSDYLNVRDGEVTYTETWAGSWGVNVMHMVTVWPSDSRLVFSSKDRNAICWYAELAVEGGQLKERFGMSVDPGCRANDVDTAKTTWQKNTFPQSPNGNAQSAPPGQEPAGAVTPGGTITGGSTTDPAASGGTTTEPVK